ncbi:MAG: tryptophan synthase subunit alpha [Dethiobacter sp.]|jgi:tryptophan synthase alpha chain|nr:MAG: tryptophan synthase subunit alpha [Dethiobacter sp.]
MTRLASVFAGRDHAALIAFVTVGYPTVEATLEAVPLLEKCGVDVVELGIPFSDPMADGVTIQQASYKALQNGITPAKCLETARLIRQKVDIPLLFMTYYNPVFRYGLDLFCADSSCAGIDGLIIPDLPLDEAGLLEKATLGYNLDLIFLIAPTSPEHRIKEIAQRSRGFIYLVSVTGITGMRKNLPLGLNRLVSKVRRLSAKPLCMGFGISTPEQAAEVAVSVDGVIIGSSIVHLMGSEKDWKPAVFEFICSVKKALVETGTLL